MPLRVKLPILLAAALAALGTAQAGARGLPASIPAPSALCRAAILQAERATGVPNRLLDAIATVESGRRDPLSGAVYPWPWTINVEGAGHVYESKADAIAAVQSFQAAGAHSIDVGCMQVNLQYHPGAFATLDQAFDPVANAAYGARFLLQLFNQTDAWPRAVAAYHSSTPDIGAEYARKVLAAWSLPQSPVGAQAITSVGAAAEPAPAGPPGRVAVLLPTGNEAIRVMPVAGPAGSSPPALTSRGLDAYRAAPVALAARPPRAF